MKTVATFILVALMCLAAQAQDSQTAVAKEPDLSIVLSSKDSVVPIGAPIMLSFVITNVSADRYCETHVLETGNPELNLYFLRMFDASGHSLPPIKQEASHRMHSVTRLCLEPGESRKEIVNLSRIFQVTQPGVYQVKVEHFKLERTDLKAVLLASSNSLSLTFK